MKMKTLVFMLIDISSKGEKIYNLFQLRIMSSKMSKYDIYALLILALDFKHFVAFSL